jgi:tetratricopeptide (TPR) repeat protein
MLGKLYYGKGAYEAAKISYDSAATFGSNPPLDNIDEVNTRKNVLTDVVKDIRIIRKQDSLLALSQKSEKEQKAIAKKEAERLKKLEQASAEPKTQVVSLTPGTTVKSNWYFYNNTLIEKGASEFKQKWGIRKLEDNWRRSAAGSMMMNVYGDSTSGKEENKLLVNGSQYETLLAEIPTTAAKRDKANNLIMNAYYDLGLIYYAQLQDYPNSISSFDSLLTKYPSTDFKKESFYTLFLDHSLLKHDTAAARYKKLLQDEFGQSEFAKLANNPAYIEEVKNSAKAIEYYYDTTYLAYKDTQYAAAMARIKYAQTAFSGKPMMAHFDLLEALCNAGLKDYVNCKLSLEHVLKAYPSTPQQAKAQELLNYLRANKLLPSNDSSALAKKDSLQLSEIQSAEGKGTYSYDANEQHLFLVYINKIDGRTLSLKSGISDFNLQKHESEELVTGQNLFTVKEGVISVSKFSNAIFAKIYLNDIVKDPTLFQKYKKEDYTICLISVSNFTELLKTRDILGYLTFHKKNY